MAETLINSTEFKTGPPEFLDPPAPAPAPSSGGSPFQQRRIEFHLARKTFTGFSIGSGDFRLETLNPSCSVGRQRPPGVSNQPSTLAGSRRKPDGSELLENGLDPELSFGITFRRIGAGLENLGNTCFLNSVLQCLTYTEPLAAYLQSGKHQTSCRTAGFCALCAIQRHVSRALQSTGRILAPKDLVSNLRCISRNFRNARQEDAHEYMVNLLESMHKCCLPSGVPSESPGAYDKSLVHKIFGGRLRSQVKCLQCNFCSNKFDPFLDLSLEIVRADSLYKALQHFTTKEQLDGGGRQYHCQQCKQKVKALKQLTIHKAPYVLTIHLKRFGSHVPGQKIDKKIHFGPTLDLKPFVTGPYDEDLKYTLYGVLVHAGWSTHSGHYYCFVRTSSGMWYSLDDNQVVQVSERKVLEQKAYMLFYVRDRRNFALKKSFDVVKKEDMAINSTGRNKMYSNFNQGFQETIQSGPILKSLNGQNSSTVVAQRDDVNFGALKETIMKEASIQKISGLVKAECSALNRDPLLECSSKPLLKDSLKEVSVLNQNKGECLPQPDSSVKGSSDAIKLDNAMITTIGAKIVDDGVVKSTKHDQSNSVTMPPSCNVLYNCDIKKESYDSVAISLNCNEDRSTTKDLSGSIAIPPNCSIPHGSPGDLCISEKTSGKNGNKASSSDPIRRTLEKVSPVMLFGRTGREDGQNGGFSQESAGGNSLGEKAGDGQKTVDTMSTELSILLVTEQISVHKKTLDRKPHQKLKKKLLKSQVISMHLGSNILFGKSLGLRKKKKQKRSKQCMSGTENLSQEHLLDWDCMPMDIGPSTSEKIKTMPFGGLALTQRKGMKSGSKKKNKSVVVQEVLTNCNGDLLMGIVDKEFRDRTGQNGAVLATDDQPQKSSITASAGNQVDAREPSSSKDSGRDSMQNGLMSMLTRGLEETLVARWDEMEFSSPMTESSGVGTMSIGYVADEWDEEYDRGKRKKVRSFKNNFGGPNPFQEIATKKAKVKKAKVDQSSSGNRPFRI